MKFTFGIVLGILIGSFLVIFIVQNSDITTITFINNTFEISKAVVILITFLIGALLGWIVSAAMIIQGQKKKIHKLKEKVENPPRKKAKLALPFFKKKDKKKSLPVETSIVPVNQEEEIPQEEE